MDRAVTPPLLEREAETAALGELIDAVVARRGGVTLVAGEAGVGKSRLLATAAGAARSRGVRVLAVRGGELERELPYGVVRELLGPPLAASSAGQRARLLGGAAALAGPVLAPAPPAADRIAPSAALHGLHWFTVELAASMPVLLVLDDAHWADPPSLRFLAYLAGRIDGLPAGLLVAARPDEHGDPRAWERLATRPGATLLRPGPLGPAAVSSMVGDALGSSDPTFDAACAAATGGNPFLLTALLDDLAGRGIAPVAAEAGRVAATPPDRVRRAVLTRLDRLGPAAAALARAAALLGDGADPSLAARLAGVPAAQAPVLLDGLVRARIVEPGPALTFVHPLVRATVEGHGSGPGERAATHRAAARLLAEEGVRGDGLLPHLLGATPVGDPWVVQELRDAARRAAARGAPEMSASHLRRALAEPPSAAERAAVLLELGIAETRAAATDAVEHLTRAADLAGTRVERGRALLALGRALWQSGRIVEAVEVLGGALDGFDGAEPADGAEREVAAELEVELVTVATQDYATRPVAVARFARREADPQPTDRVACMMLAALAIEEVVAVGSRERAIHLAEQALLGDLLHDDRAANALPSAVLALTLAGRIRRSIDLWDATIDRQGRRGNVQGFAFASALRGYAHYCAGDLAASLADTRATVDLARAHELPAVGALAAAWSGFALVDTGQCAAAEEEVAPFLAATIGSSGSLTAVYLLSARAHLRMAQGRPAEAIADLRECAARRTGFSSPGLVRWRPQLAAALHAAGEPEEAATVAREAVALARSWGAPHVLAEALRVEGLVIGGPAGLELLRESVTVAAASDSALEHARATAAFGGALRRAGRRGDARAALQPALDAAVGCGATALACATRDELVGCGARPRRLPTTGAASLTPTERRVAETVAGGLTNRAAAQALFVSERTIEAHLRHAYAKLGISSRSQLRRALDER
ncbi:ATP-binding protein [Pseudonocardia sp.]|uniref:ATP-binding protein n=1 Tax=Pseudonocardia sp. TaxID=60912 RepID=UPI003D0A5E4D